MMTVYEAIQILKPEDNTMESLRKRYKKMARKYHPDLNPQGGEIMRLINQAFSILASNLLNWQPWKKQENDLPSLDERIQEILDQIGHLPGLKFEICGNWLWVSGNSYPHRKQLKEAGLFFAPKKKMWFWRPEEYKSSGRGKWSIEEIRDRHGSTPVQSHNRQQLNESPF